MTRSRVRIAAALAAALAACSGSGVPEGAPRPLSVEPSSAYASAGAAVVIRGDGFRVEPYQAADGELRVDATFRARLGGAELADVRWISQRELRARVPAGLAAGTHRLEVMDPRGVTGALAGAFTAVGAAPPALDVTATFDVDVATSVGQAVMLEIALTNAGGVVARSIVPAVRLSGPALAGPADLPVPADVAPGETRVVRLAYTAVAFGTASITVGASGTDGVTGTALAARTEGTDDVRVGRALPPPDEATLVADDPFQDGTSFSFVFGYAGQVFLGPSGDGGGLVRCAPDGTGCASVALSFLRDTTASIDPGDGTSVATSVSASACPNELTTLGSQSQCNADDPASTPCACGPDAEVGRGVMGSFRLGAGPDEWLVAMGRVKKRGELSYLYLTRDAISPLELLYADLSLAMPSSHGVQNVVSMAEAGGQLHLALQTDAGEPPRMVVLRATPTSPGLDATAGDAFGISFRGTDLDETGPGNSPVAQVDAVAGFEGRLFVANRRGVLVSNGPASSLAGGAATSQFAECTPLDPADWTTTAIARYPADRDVTPADRGVTGLIEWQGKLYLARNTAAEPELWAFTPRHDPGTGAFVGCEPDRSDWRLVATNLGDAGNTHLTALFASGRYLYVGYDAAGGAQLWRTEAPAPVADGDFAGAGGCAAGTVGTGGTPCAPIAGPGLGSATVNTRFFDARAIRDGAVDQVWVTVGSGDAPVGVYRILEP